MDDPNYRWRCRATIAIASTTSIDNRPAFIWVVHVSIGVDHAQL